LKRLQNQAKENAKSQFLLAAERGNIEAACLLGEMCLEEIASQESNKQSDKKKGSKIGSKPRHNRLTLLITRG